MSSRPENQAPPEIFYGEGEAEKYTRNTRYLFLHYGFEID